MPEEAFAVWPALLVPALSDGLLARGLLLGSGGLLLKLPALRSRLKQLPSRVVAASVLRSTFRAGGGGGGGGGAVVADEDEDDEDDDDDDAGTEAFFLPEEALSVSAFEPCLGSLALESLSLASAVAGGCISAASACAACAAVEEEEEALFRGLERVLRARGCTAPLVLLAEVAEKAEEEEGVTLTLASPFSSSSIASLFFSSVISDEDEDEDEDKDDKESGVFSSAGIQSRTCMDPLKSLLLLACLESCSPGRPLGLASSGGLGT